jgi:hypothetical protein
MGGLLICLSIILPTLLWADLKVLAVWVALAGLTTCSPGKLGTTGGWRSGRGPRLAYPSSPGLGGPSRRSSS